MLSVFSWVPAVLKPHEKWCWLLSRRIFPKAKSDGACTNESTESRFRVMRWEMEGWALSRPEVDRALRRAMFLLAATPRLYLASSGGALDPPATIKRRRAVFVSPSKM